MNNLFLESYIPDLLSEQVYFNNPTFVTLIEKFLRYLEEQNMSSHYINQIAPSRDIDRVLDVFIERLEFELGPSIPAQNIGDKRLYLKKLKELYLSRGTNESIDSFFRIFFNSLVEIEYPKDNLLIPSSGIPSKDSNGDVITSQVVLQDILFGTIDYNEHTVLPLHENITYTISFDTANSSVYFVGSGTDTTFTIETPDVISVTGVYLNLTDDVSSFIEQTEGAEEDYTVSGQTVTFNTAPDDEVVILITFTYRGNIMINGEPNAKLTLRRGSTYVFDDYNTTDHALAFRDSSSNPVTMDSVTTTSSSLTFTVPNTAPDYMEYYCSDHTTTDEETGSVEVLNPEKFYIADVTGDKNFYDIRRVQLFIDGIEVKKENWRDYNFTDYGSDALVIHLNNPISDISGTPSAYVFEGNSSYPSLFEVIYNPTSISEETKILIGTQELVKNEDYYIDYVQALQQKEATQLYKTLLRNVYLTADIQETVGSEVVIDFSVNLPFHIRDISLFGSITVNGVTIDLKDGSSVRGTDSYYYNDNIHVSPTKLFFSVVKDTIDPLAKLSNNDSFEVSIDYFAGYTERLIFDVYALKDLFTTTLVDGTSFQFIKNITNYLATDGFLSETSIVLQDSYKYQIFSYIIKSGIDPSLWQNAFNRLINPAGFTFFTEYLLIIYLIAGEIPKKLIPNVQPGFQEESDISRPIIIPKYGVAPESFGFSIAETDYEVYVSTDVGQPIPFINSNNFGPTDFLEALKFDYSNSISTFKNYTVQDAINNNIDLNIASEITIS